MNIICPECGFDATGLKVIKWGDGVQKVDVAPYICSGCGAFALINFVAKRVEFMPPEALEFIRTLNPELHAKLVEAQTRVRAARKGETNN